MHKKQSIQYHQFLCPIAQLQLIHMSIISSVSQSPHNRDYLKANPKHSLLNKDFSLGCEMREDKGVFYKA